MRNIINGLTSMCRTYLDRVMFGNSHFRNLQLLGPNVFMPSSSSESESKTVFEQALWFAAPKSKVCDCENATFDIEMLCRFHPVVRDKSMVDLFLILSIG